MPLDSDVAQADSQLMVEFYEQDRGVLRGSSFVKIIIPGNDKLVIDTLATDSHKRRFPHAWLRYQMKQAGDTVAGTPLTVWAGERPEELNRDQLAELQIFKFQTVEQVRGMSDLIAQKIGMGGIGLREKARAYLAEKNKAEANSELTATRNELEALKQQVALLLGNQAASAPVIVAAQPSKKRGPKPGWKNKVNEQHAPSVGATGSE